MKGMHVGREFGAPKWMHTAGALDRIVTHVARRRAREPLARPARRPEHGAAAGTRLTRRLARSLARDVRHRRVRRLRPRPARPDAALDRAPRARRRRASTSARTSRSACAASRSSTSRPATSRSTATTATSRSSSTARSTTTPSCAASSRPSGRRFVTDHSDTEVILRGFEEWGPHVVDHLTGMFAFAISDDEQRRAVPRPRPARHQAAVLRRRARRGFAFASELKAIFQDARVRRQPDLDVVRRFLLFRVHDDGEDTFFDGVKRLLPGHTMLVRPDGIVKIERYWNPAVNPEFASSRSDDDYARGVRRALGPRRRAAPDLRRAGRRAALGRARLERRRVDDGAPAWPRGTDLHTDGLYTFSALYPGESIDESEYIHEVERAVGSIPHYAYPQLDDFWNEITEWIWFQEEPTKFTSAKRAVPGGRLCSKH